MQNDRRDGAELRIADKRRESLMGSKILDQPSG